MQHPVMIFGVLLSSAAVLAVVLRYFKQSAIIAFIAVGLLAGLFRGTVHIPSETLDIFTELGIIFLLFTAGLEMDFESLRKRWRIVAANGFGQILLNWLLAGCLGWFVLGIQDTMELAFFALCLTFSSTIIVLGVLKRRREMESYHGQIILGLMVLQDITAVMSLAVLQSLTAEGALVVSLGGVFGKLVASIVVLAVLAKWILPTVFRHLAETQELLFVGSLGWVLGVAAACQAIGFSPEIGAFLAGAALSSLPYRLEIQDKVEPMRDFGIVLFFLALGYNLKIDASTVHLLAPILAIVAFVVLGTPFMMLIIGFLTRSKSRPAFLIGGIINQISEFSLILAILCLQAGVFTERTFSLVTLSTVLTMFLSSFGHQVLERIYGIFRRLLSVIDRHAVVAPPPPRGLENHVVVIGYNELAEIFIQYYLGRGDTVLVMDIDPAVHEMFERRDENLTCFYADIFDPDSREEAGLAKAKLIVSCMNEAQDAELAILYWLKVNGFKAAFIAATDSEKEMNELYTAGATFVIQTEEMAARQIASLLELYGASPSALGKEAPSYR